MSKSSRRTGGHSSSEKVEIGRAIRREIRKAKRGIIRSELARRVNRHRSNVGRWLKRHEIVLAPPKHLPAIELKRKDRRLKALALVALGLNREQVEQLLGIKSETIRHYLLELGRTTSRDLWPNCDEIKGLDDELAKSYDMDHVITEVWDAFKMRYPEDAVPVPEREFLYLFNNIPLMHSGERLRKLRRILERPVTIQGSAFMTSGYRGQTVRIPMTRRQQVAMAKQLGVQIPPH